MNAYKLYPSSNPFPPHNDLFIKACLRSGLEGRGRGRVGRLCGLAVRVPGPPAGVTARLGGPPVLKRAGNENSIRAA